MTAALRPLGRTGIDVHPLCLGGNVFGWTADERASFEVLDAYVEAGGNFIDTAESYSSWVEGHQGGESEAVIGRWLASRPGMRERVVIATKVAPPLGGERIRDACEASLRRLGVESVDVYYAHFPDADTPLTQSLSAFDALVREGKVRALACSNHSVPQLRAALAAQRAQGWATYGLEQPPYSLMNRSFEGDLAAVCREEGMGAVGYAALAGGFLTGKYRRDGPAPGSKRLEAVTRRYMNDHGWRVLDALLEVAAAAGAPPAQVALAWVLAKPDLLTGAIASATSAAQVADLMAASDLRLDPELVERLDEASRPAS